MKSVVLRLLVVSSALLAIHPPCWAASSAKQTAAPVAKAPTEVISTAEKIETAETLPQIGGGRITWGVFLKEENSAVFNVFSDWLRHIDQANPPANAAIVNLAAYMTQRELASAPAESNVQSGQPPSEFGIDIDGENYQAAQVAIAGVDARGQKFGMAPLSAAMPASGRFQLRLVSSFDAVAILSNLNARGIATQLYPSQKGQALVIEAGKPVWLPLGDKEYFQFTGEPGGTRLVISLRDPRALLADQAASAPVFRHDEASGSSFVQPRQTGRYPVIAEVIRLHTTAP